MAVSQRMSIQDVDYGAYKAVFPLQKYISSGGIDEKLLLLIQIRSSQLNQCAWCLDMHLTEARKQGIPQRKLDLIAAWREAPSQFTDEERAILAFTEQVTLISQGGVSDEVWADLRSHFDEKKTLTLLMAVAAINVWNRMNVTVHSDLAPAGEPVAAAA
ncbi:MAG TPA: carboxymuconolactone decarboxylase family protein [Microbacteriaceae bacterium]|nr:carboxymuconolactone decarboxylase family protein [Microbacteriaceae bacterium]